MWTESLGDWITEGFKYRVIWYTLRDSDNEWLRQWGPKQWVTVTLRDDWGTECIQLNFPKQFSIFNVDNWYKLLCKIWIS